MTLRIALFGQAPVAVDCLDRLHQAAHALDDHAADENQQNDRHGECERDGREPHVSGTGAEIGLDLFHRVVDDENPVHAILGEMARVTGPGIENGVDVSEDRFSIVALEGHGSSAFGGRVPEEVKKDLEPWCGLGKRI